MARHPGAQAENRLREILPKLVYYVNKVRQTNYDVIGARNKLELATEENINADQQYRAIQNIIDKMAMDSVGIYPWGLPASITISEFKLICPEADIPDSDLIAERNRLDNAMEDAGE